MSKQDISRQSIIAALTKTAKASGLPGMVIGFEVDGIVTTHLENVPMSAVSRIVITLFQQMCDFEASQGHVTPEYRDAMMALKIDFLKLIESHNEKFKAIATKNKK